jgi:hypothetical protein
MSRPANVGSKPKRGAMSRYLTLEKLMFRPSSNDNTRINSLKTGFRERRDLEEVDAGCLDISLNACLVNKNGIHRN